MKYGIFGGAFNPFHSEHARIVEGVYEALGLDGIILLPSYNPPHKNKTMEAFADRAEMLKRWAKDRPYVIVDTLEDELGLGNSYTYEVLPKLFERYKGNEFVYVIGGDSMLMFHTWVKPEVIAKQVKIAVVARAGYPEIDFAVTRARTDFGANVEVVALDCREVSSSELWAKLQLGIDTGDQIPEEVKSYIDEKELYNSNAEMLNKIKTYMSEELFAHVSRTALYAARHARAALVDVYKAFTAAVLHDVAKEIKPLHPIESYETAAPKVIHQYDGAELAERDFGIKDAEILDAIRYHTTGKPEMTALGKLIYCADKLEDARDFAGIEIIRNALDDDFETGFELLVSRSVTYLTSKGTVVDGLTADCAAYYTKK